MINRARQTLASLSLAAIACVALAGCKSRGEIVVDEGVGITAIRTTCPAVGIADYTGDVTLFEPPARGAPPSYDASAIDVTAAMTDVRSQCDSSSDKVHSTVTFSVLARRTDKRGARSVTLPFYLTVVRGTTAVIAKRIGTVTVNFAGGQDRAQATGQGTAFIDKSEATLPADIRKRVTEKRKAGEADAAIDPLSLPDVKEAVARATFEVMVGFQLTDDQLKYNVTR
jgi:hypothetical protein